MKRFCQMTTAIIISFFLFSFIRQNIIRNEIVQANGSVTVDGPVSFGAFTGNPTLSHISGTGENRLLLVGVSWGRSVGDSPSRTITRKEYNGIELTPIIVNTEDPLNCIAIFRYPGEAPDGGTVENPNIIIEFSSIGTNVIVGAINFAGVDLDDPIGSIEFTKGVEGNPSVNLSTQDGEMLFDTISTKYTLDLPLTADAGQTEHWKNFINDGNTKFGAASTKTATSTNTTMSWTPAYPYEPWAMAAVAIKPAQQALPGIGDFVWIDRNGDGIQDSDEIGLPEVVVNLYQDGGSTPYLSTITDANGHYSLEDVPPGNYFLQFTHPMFDLIFTSQDQGTDDTIDSDVDLDGLTSIFSEFDNHFDAGILAPQNPSLSTSCGLDIALVVDTSSSVDANTFDQIGSALTDFIDRLLPGTRTQMSVVQYGSEAEVVQDWTSDPAPINDAISTRHNNGIYSNWDDALYKARNLFPSSRPDAPDLIIFITDSNPTAFNGHGEDQPFINQEVSTAFAYVIPEAFAAKADAIRLLALNIGDTSNTTRHLEIIGPLISPAEPISLAVDIIETNTSDLTSALQDLAGEMCGGTCTIHNIIDTDGELFYDPDGNIIPEDSWLTEGSTLQDWEYTISNLQAGLNLADGHNNPLVTGAEGDVIAYFQITATPTSFDIEETLKNDWQLLDVQCFSNGIALASILETGTTVAYILFTGSDEILSCYFYNYPSPTAVTLLSFTANVVGESVLLEWETASEVDNLGFNLYREDLQSGLKLRINPNLIPSKIPGGSEGDMYDFVDNDVIFGEPYAYWLEALDLRMRIKDQYGPVVTLWWQFFLPLFSVGP